MEKIYDMIIVGGGPGGYTAALYAVRAGLEVLLVERLSAGGQMNLTGQIDNYPGFPEGVDGFQLSYNMQQQAERFGAKTRYAEVLELQLAGEVKTIRTNEGEYFAKSVVISTGANPRQLGVARENEMIGRGVGYCAHCDGGFYRGKTVAVVGGGNSAVAEALYLSRIAKEVILIHRRDSLRATHIYQKPLQEAGNIRFVWDSEVTELLGEEVLSGVKIRNLKSGEEQILEIQGLFVSIGRKPATDLVKDQLTLDGAGYIMAGENTKTNLPGVYAVGDVRTKELRQIVTAVADGAMAAHVAEQEL
ncbi:MAG: thioredoxin-disulfide reductase [Oscillospiraceae bacterium]|nr:thioredoxin-disulfide reductase [Oscillospiraceae bacterium]